MLFTGNIVVLRLVQWMLEPEKQRVCVDNAALGMFLSLIEDECVVSVGLGKTALEAVDEAAIYARCDLANMPPEASLLYIFGGALTDNDIEVALRLYSNLVPEKHNLLWGYSDTTVPISLLLPYYSRKLSEENNKVDLYDRMTQHARYRKGYFSEMLIPPAPPAEPRKKWATGEEDGVVVFLVCGR
ncbi:MAG TPA: hypothetical protein PLV42_05525 [bacterium]|nr:hypothetical protein [bacterium]